MTFEEHLLLLNQQGKLSDKALTDFVQKELEKQVAPYMGALNTPGVRDDVQKTIEHALADMQASSKKLRPQWTTVTAPSPRPGNPLVNCDYYADDLGLAQAFARQYICEPSAAPSRGAQVRYEHEIRCRCDKCRNGNGSMKAYAAMSHSERKMQMEQEATKFEVDVAAAEARIAKEVAESMRRTATYAPPYPGSVAEAANGSHRSFFSQAELDNLSSYGPALPGPWPDMLFSMIERYETGGVSATPEIAAQIGAELKAALFAAMQRKEFKSEFTLSEIRKAIDVLEPTVCGGALTINNIQDLIFKYAREEDFARVVFHGLENKRFFGLEVAVLERAITELKKHALERKFYTKSGEQYYCEGVATAWHQLGPVHVMMRTLKGELVYIPAGSWFKVKADWKVEP